MRPELLWADTVPPRDDQKNAINDLCFSPDGSRMVVAVGYRVLVYDAHDGNLLHSLRGHKDTVYTVDWSADGKRFASGAADRTVIVWSSKAEGVLKYTHNDSIQRVAHDPSSGVLASCTGLDFGLWSQEEKSVVKHKVPAKILSAAWATAGRLLALGFADGKISIRGADGSEKAVITRGAPVWCLSWSAAPDELDVLAVGCWDQTLSFYKASGAQHAKDRSLGFNPCAVGYCRGGDYIVYGGSDRQVSLCTREGAKMGTVCRKGAWVWCAAGRPGHDAVAIGCDDGSIEMHRLRFRDVRSLHKDRYACRDRLTDVIVQHLVSEQKVRIKCRDYVQQVSVYRDWLAVAVPERRVLVYELVSRDDNFDLHYKLKERVHLPPDQPPQPELDGDTPTPAFGAGAVAVAAAAGSSAAAERDFDHCRVTAEHLLTGQGKRLRLFDMRGCEVREWMMDSQVRCVKSKGGPPGGECFLLGLQDGSVWQIFVDNPFPIELMRAPGPVACCDISLYRRKVAAVTEDGWLALHDAVTKELELQEVGVVAAAFNLETDNIFCFSGNGSLATKIGAGPPERRRCRHGEVAAVRGAKAYCVRGTGVSAVDLSFADGVSRAVAGGALEQAYRLASLGATPAEWRQLAAAALAAAAFPLARRALTRVGDGRFVDLVAELEERLARGGPLAVAELGPAAAAAAAADTAAEVLAYRGQYSEAAKAWVRAGMPAKAVEMFVDLRRWEQAKVFAASSGAVDMRELVRRQAAWAEEVNDWRAAADMYVAAGQPLRAAAIVVESKGEGWQHCLADVARGCTAAGDEDRAALALCGKAFAEAGVDALAREVFEKLGDLSSLMAMYVGKQKWPEALKLSEEHAGKFDRGVLLPYAQWLCECARHDESIEAFRRAGRPDRALGVVDELVYNAIVKARFKDASYYYWLSAREAYKMISLPKSQWGPVERAAAARAAAANAAADVYCAYAVVYAFTTDPFTSAQPETVFHASRFLLNLLGSLEALAKAGGGGGASLACGRRLHGVLWGPEGPAGVSRVHALYALGKQAKAIGAFKLARFALDRLQQQRVPPGWVDLVELDILALQAKPVRDAPELLPVCYRCGAMGALLNATAGSGGAEQGDSCTTCGHTFVRSFLNFEVLPLVEFVPARGVSDEEALDLIRVHNSGHGRHHRTASKDKWREGKLDNADVMQVGDSDPADADVGDPAMASEEAFNRCINAALETQDANKRYVPVTVDARTLLRLRREEVFCLPAPAPGMKASFYKNMMPEIPVAVSPTARRFAHEEDFEFAYLKEGRCPYSRAGDVGDYGAC